MALGAYRCERHTTFVEERRRPQVRVIARALGDVGGEPIERIGIRSSSLADDGAVQVLANGLSVPLEVPGDN